MKNNKSLIVLFVALIVCLTCLFTACNNNAQDARDPQIVAIYDSYVADAAEKGETPLSYEEWLNSIKGAKGDKGDKGDTGAQGEQGIQGEKGEKGDKGDNGVDGKSAYELWKAANPESTLTLEQWLESLKGADGQNGTNGNNGVDGKSAYELWKEANPDSNLTQAEWLASLVGSQGPKGDKGDKGDTGATGAQGEQGIQGEKGDKGDKGDTGATGAQGEQGIQGEKGDKGDKGDTGATGATGRIGFIVSTADQFKAAVTVDNAYVLLASDITLTDEETIVITKNVVVDLGGHTVTGKYVIIASGESAHAIVKNGKIVSSAEALTSTRKAELVVENLDVTAQECCLGADRSATLIVNSGTYTSKDNFVVMTNGTGGLGGNTIVINGGTFNGNIQSKGYIAGGIYVANNDEVTVNGGTFNITNGVGIVARSGKTTVSANVQINLTAGDRTEGWVGDKKLNLPTGKELILDLASNYPGGTPTLENNSNYSVCTFVSASTAEELQAAIDAGNGVALSKDIVLTEKVTISKSVLIDLAGHTVTGDRVFEAVGEGVYAIVVNGKIVTGEALYAVDGATLVVDKLDVTAQENCLGANKAGNLIVNGGTYTSKDNFVVMTNGTGGLGGNTIVINGGTFNGNIQTKGYIAGGIYVANNDEVTVNGGTFNITNGVGIVARSGKTTVNEGVIFNITCDGTITAGRVGDAKIDITIPHELVLDTSANYPGGAPTIVNNTSLVVYEHTTNA